jgi:hypothetical protein
VSTAHDVIPEPSTCTHERRPGTTVCLLCRQEARLAAADRRKKMLLRGTAVGIIVAVIALGMSNAVLSRAKSGAPPADPAAAARVQGTSAPADSIVTQGNAATASVANQPLSPILKPGETPLQFGVKATRSDSGMVVAFDTPELRTRIPEKFERFLRWSLPQLYGPRADSLLAAIPIGTLVSQGNLLYELPTRGIHLPIDSSWKLEIYPEIRPGQDGPLVIRYRASVVRE